MIFVRTKLRNIKINYRNINDTPEVVAQNCSMDIVGHLTQTSKGNKYILTFQDELSNYTMAVSIQQQDAITVARVFVEKIIWKFGILQVLTIKVLNSLEIYSQTYANC